MPESNEQNEHAAPPPTLKRDVGHAVELAAAVVTLAKEGPPLVKAGAEKLQAALKRDPPPQSEPSPGVGTDP